MNDRAGLAALLALVLALSLAAPVAMAGSSGAPTDEGSAGVIQPDAEGSTGTASASLAAEEPVEGNQTVRFLDPETYVGTGDLAALADQVGQDLSESQLETLEAAEGGAFDEARERIAESREREERYGVASGDSEEVLDVLRQANDRLEALIDRVEAFDETAAAYWAATERDEDELAVELAREAETEAATIETQADELAADFRAVENRTGTDQSGTIERIESLEASVAEDTAEIRADAFEPTELTLAVEEDTPTVSPLSPLIASGTLETADGEPLEAETVTIVPAEEPDRATTVDLEQNGSFELSHRPMLAPTGETELTFVYRPDREAPYDRSEASVAVAVEPVEPTIDVALEALDGDGAAGGDTDGADGADGNGADGADGADADGADADGADESVRADDEIAVAAAVAVDDGDGESIPVDGVETTVLIGNVPVGEAIVEDGDASTTVTVPVDVPAGEQPVIVRHEATDLAVGPGEGSETVTVAETGTELSIDAHPVNESAVVVAGVLETADGEAVGGEPVTLSIDGTAVGTAETDEAGAFETVVPVDAVGDGANGTVDEENPDDEIVVTATYDEPGTNLASASAEAETGLAPAEGLVQRLLGPIVAVLTLLAEPWLLAGIGGLSLVAVLAVGFALVQGWRPRLPAGIVLTGGDRGAPLEAGEAAGEEGGPETMALTGGSGPPGDGPDAGADPSGSIGTPEPAPVWVLLEHARGRVAARDGEGAVRAAYGAVRAALADAVDERALTHWEFSRRAELEAPAERDLEAVTEAYERARFAPTGVSIEDAREVLDRARGLCERDPDESPPAAAD